MEIFKLLGEVSIDISEASAKLDELIEKAKTLKSTVNNIGSINVGTNGGTTTSTTGTTSTRTSTSGTQTDTSGASGGTTIIPTKGVSSEKKNSKKKSVWDTIATVGVAKAANWAIDMGWDAITGGWNYAITEDVNTAKFRTMLGLTDEEADSLYEDVKSFAKKTPFSPITASGIIERMIANGIPADEAFDYAWMFSDLAMGDKEKMEKGILPFVQTMSLGYLSTPNAKQFAEGGYNIYEWLATYFNTTGRSLEDRTVTGVKYDWTKEDVMGLNALNTGNANPAAPVSSEELKAAMMYQTGEHGNYYKATGNIMNTPYGQTQVLAETWESTAGEIMDGVVDLASGGFIESLTHLLEAVSGVFMESDEAAKASGGRTREEVEDDMGFGTGVERTKLDELAIGAQVLLNDLTNKSTVVGRELTKAYIDLAGGLGYDTDKGLFGGLKLLTSPMGAYATKSISERAAIDRSIDFNAEMEKAKRTFVEIFDPHMENHTDAPMTADDVLMQQSFNALKLLKESIGEWANETGKDVNEWVNETFGGDTRAPTSGPSPDATYFNDQHYIPGQKGLGGSLLNALPDDNGGSDMLMGKLAEAITAMGNIKTDVSAAVAEGIGGITITGTVTTGDVRLNTGALVGQITPRINLILGRETANGERG